MRDYVESLKECVGEKFDSVSAVLLQTTVAGRAGNDDVSLAQELSMTVRDGCVDRVIDVIDEEPFSIEIDGTCADEVVQLEDSIATDSLGSILMRPQYQLCFLSEEGQESDVTEDFENVSLVTIDAASDDDVECDTSFVTIDAVWDEEVECDPFSVNAVDDEGLSDSFASEMGIPEFTVTNTFIASGQHDAFAQYHRRMVDQTSHCVGLVSGDIQGPHLTSIQRRLLRLADYPNVGTTAHHAVPSAGVRRWIRVAGLRNDTTSEVISSHLARRIGCNDVVSRPLHKRNFDPTSLPWVTFKVGVPDMFYDAALDVCNWPARVNVREFLPDQVFHRGSPRHTIRM